MTAEKPNWLEKSSSMLIVAFVVGVMVVLPVGLWIAKEFFGWVPPEAIQNIIEKISFG